MTLDSGAYLKQEGVADHLEKIVNQVILEKPKDAYALVEVLSRLVKEPASGGDERELTEEDLQLLADRIKKARVLDKVPVSEDNEPVVVPCAVPDMMEELEMLTWAGVGLGELETYKIMCSIRNMSTKQEGYTKIRFWGKILGTDADYYVAEASRDGGGDAEEGEDMDPPGTGVNAFTYFVTTDLAGDWVKLPDIKTREIVAARLIKRMLSGNPQAKVLTHPYFDGKEEVLLRAQIARISADCTICMKGLLIREDPEDPTSAIVDNTEFVLPPTKDLMVKGGWTHMVPHIMKNGRTAYQELPDPDEEPVAYKAAKLEMEGDPPRDVLRDLSEDGLGWVIKQAGDPSLARNPVDGKLESSAVTYVRSLTWPGAVCVAQKATYTNLYVGYGFMAGEPDFFPPAPPEVQDEPEDLGEAPEPQGEEEEEEGEAAEPADE
mmetsp:Transcript_57727/g.122807  ORF Transcript_57727/g.122807 Transcript_57727/m.122807 type:complete len:435 (-) Transcript_57727:53-1357(-)